MAHIMDARMMINMRSSDLPSRSNALRKRNSTQVSSDMATRNGSCVESKKDKDSPVADTSSTSRQSRFSRLTLSNKTKDTSASHLSSRASRKSQYATGNTLAMARPNLIDLKTISSETVEWEGYLYKQRKLVKSWTPRYVTLHDSTIKVYKSKAHAIAKGPMRGSWSITQINSELPSTGFGAAKLQPDVCGFTIVATDGSQIHLIACTAVQNSSNTVSIDLLRMSNRFRPPTELLSASHMRITARREYSATRPPRNEQADWIDRDAIFEDVESRTDRQSLIENQDRDEKKEQTRSSSDINAEVNVSINVYDIECNASDGGLGVILSPVSEQVLKCFKTLDSRVPKYQISAFERNGLGQTLWVESSGKVNIGDGILAIQDHWIKEDTYYEVLELLWTSKNPVKLTLARIGSWHCPHCTLINPVALLICAACGLQVRYFNIDISDD
ncbi:hypothetical protein ABG067_001917 [Albugo candida]